jgi:spore maturation protein CgeB
MSLKISFFASSLVSSYWNGAATYYRGIIRALASRGHKITFYEPDAYDRQKNRDIPDPEWAKVVVYKPEQHALMKALEDASGADLIVKASGVGVFDEELEKAVIQMRKSGQLVAFWDVDAPATLDRVQKNAQDPFLKLIPQYDLIFTYGGGDPVINAYLALGAKKCIPVYNAVDPETHFPVKSVTEFQADLSFLGNRLPDREARVEEFFLNPAKVLKNSKFILGGNGWKDKPIQGNINYIGHVPTHFHNAFNSSPLAVLNIARDSMAKYGFSPATRIFEAAGAASCIITDEWKGIECFFEPGKEILIAGSGEEVVSILDNLDPQRARSIGQRAIKRVLNDHTYEQRAGLVEEALGFKQEVFI